MQLDKYINRYNVVNIHIAAETNENKEFSTISCLIYTPQKSSRVPKDMDNIVPMVRNPYVQDCNPMKAQIDRYIGFYV